MISKITDFLKKLMKPIILIPMILIGGGFSFYVIRKSKNAMIFSTQYQTTFIQKFLEQITNMYNRYDYNQTTGTLVIRPKLLGFKPLITNNTFKKIIGAIASNKCKVGVVNSQELAQNPTNEIVEHSLNTQLMMFSQGDFDSNVGTLKSCQDTCKSIEALNKTKITYFDNEEALIKALESQQINGIIAYSNSDILNKTNISFSNAVSLLDLSIIHKESGLPSIYITSALSENEYSRLMKEYDDAMSAPQSKENKEIKEVTSECKDEECAKTIETTDSKNNKKTKGMKSKIVNASARLNKTKQRVKKSTSN